jgi:hypothetical protein
VRLLTVRNTSRTRRAMEGRSSAAPSVHQRLIQRSDTAHSPSQLSLRQLCTYERVAAGGWGVVVSDRCQAPRA